MTQNPYQFFPASEKSETFDEDESASEMLLKWRARQRRWNTMCYLVSAGQIVLAVGIGFLSNALHQAESKGLGVVALWVALCLFAGGCLACVFGPISWFWTGQYRRRN